MQQRTLACNLSFTYARARVIVQHTLPLAHANTKLILACSHYCCTITCLRVVNYCDATGASAEKRSADAERTKTVLVQFGQSVKEASVGAAFKHFCMIELTAVLNLLRADAAVSKHDFIGAVMWLCRSKIALREFRDAVGSTPAFIANNSSGSGGGGGGSSTGAGGGDNGGGGGGGGGSTADAFASDSTGGSSAEEEDTARKRGGGGGDVEETAPPPRTLEYVQVFCAKMNLQNNNF